LRNELESVAFIPVPVEDTVDFIEPQSAVILPKPLAKVFDDGTSQQSVLFGTNLASKALLGLRALRCVTSLGFLDELTPDRLIERWDQGVVGTWLAIFEESVRDKKLADLLIALADLDSDDSWKNSNLACLPTENNGWISRQKVKRFPREWNVLSQEAAIQTAMAPLLG
jgi:hypothetical protein